MPRDELLCIRQLRRLEELCRNSVQRLSSVPHRHADGVDSKSHWLVVRLVMVRPRASRPSSHRVTSGGRGVGFGVACSGTPDGYRRFFPFSLLLRTFSCIFPCCRSPCTLSFVLREAHQKSDYCRGHIYDLSSFLFSRLLHFSFILSTLLRQQRAVDVAASLKPTVAASAERSRANFEVGHGLSGTRFFASDASADNWWCIS